MSEALDIETPRPGEPAQPATHAFSRVMAFIADDVTRQALLRIAADSGWRQPLVEPGGIEAAIEHLSGVTSPDLLFVDLSESENALADINALADVCDPGTKVVALGNENDVKLYRGLVASGVVDYLVKPVTPADVLRAVAEAAGSLDKAHGPRHGRLVIVSGARGGVGTTTFATSMAWLAAEKYGARTAFLDLDLRFGTGALAFDAEPGTGVAEMLEDPDRIDPLFLERASVVAGERLSLFATEAPLAAAPPLRPDAVKVLAEELLRTYEWVIVDMPRDTVANQPDLISIADMVMLVTDLSLAAMRDALRLRALVTEHGPQARLRLIGCETRPPSKGDLPRAEFERTLGASFVATVPLDRKAVGEADGRGRPLAAGRGKAAAAIGKFARDLFTADDNPKKKKKPGLFSIRMSGGKRA